MKLNMVALTIGTAAVLLSGCESPDGTPNRTATGALAGGAIGLASGALLAGRHDGGAAALLGGALGAITGGLIGASMDEQARARLQDQAPQTYARVDQGQPLSLADVKALVASGVGDDVIISQIRNSRTVFHLSSNDIIDLKNSGVDSKVLDYMINTPSTIGGMPGVQNSDVVIDSTPPPVPAETILTPPGPDYVWVDGEWVWNGGWVWVAGHWLLPPVPHAVWIGGYWSRGPHGYRHFPGHWR